MCVIATVGGLAVAIPPDLEDIPGFEGSRSSEGSRPAGSSGTTTSGGVRTDSGAGAAGEASSAHVAVPFPHPIISEVLYAVPAGMEGDADRNGTRDAAADEFVEVFNPHGRAIDLAGYVLTDGTEGDSRFRFVFPSVRLEPGAVAVVFNGHDGGPPVAKGAGAPGTVARHELFHDAWVMAARPDRRGVAFANEGDLVLLTSPQGVAVHRVAWGSMARADASRAAAMLDEVVPPVRAGSVQRRGVGKEDRWAEHRTLTTPTASALFSPGWYVPAPAPASTTGAPGATSAPQGDAAEREGERRANEGSTR